MTDYCPQPPSPPSSGDPADAVDTTYSAPLYRAGPPSDVGPAPPPPLPPPLPPTGRRPAECPLVSQITPLGALPTAPGHARAHVRDTLERWGLSAYAEVAELVMSEIVTNAVTASTDEHGQPVYRNGQLPVIVVRLVATQHGVVLEVWDTVPTPPAIRQPHALEEHGRGLLLVDRLAFRWAWRAVPDWPGKCVWAELRP
jgi:anti-sigma regulatory factor (Ser/Thr protein kinase)